MEKQKSSNNEKFLNDFLWSISDVVNEEKTILSAAFEKLTGFTSKEINSRPGKYLSLVHAEDLNNVSKAISDLENDKSKSYAEQVYRITTKENKSIWLKERIIAGRNSEGKFIKLTRIAHDVSDFKNNEKKLESAKNTLRELNATKDRFISIVSHDLRAPFTSLLGFAEILINEPELALDERIEYLNYIYDASKNQLQLINYLLDWSRLQTGSIQIEPRRINIHKIISECVSVLTGAAIRKEIEIKTDVSPELHINADDRLTNQAISNLISNAIKFTPAGKRVYISAGNFKEGMIEITVRDEGVGISEENQTKIFKIDRKFSTEGTQGENGSGLGLTLVKEIIDKHGGNIWFYSKEGEGSEFHITLPEAKNNILLVEDDPGIRSLYKKVIEKSVANFKIIEVNNGYEAMTTMLNEMPSLVITDHDMPLMNGIQLIEAMREKDRNNSVQIVVISAKFEDDIIDKYHKLGVEKLLNKPVELNALADIIKQSVTAVK